MILNNSLLMAFIGGLLIGLASLLMLLFNGRILGVSGILGGLMIPTEKAKFWRLAFLGGLFAGGLVIGALLNEPFAVEISRTWGSVVAAGLLVGFGTRLGNGCTSGHGVCGISRLSARSILATATFMAAGAATVFVVNHLWGGSV